MMLQLVVTGTDTGVGKTLFSAGLVGALSGFYWKPIQSGLEEESDSQCVRRLGEVPPRRVLPEAYRLNKPASPHLSARIDGVEIEPGKLEPPETAGPLVIEGAGGLLVPLTDTVLLIDVFARWQIPIVLCARTSLGTINHTLLSLEALRSRAIPVLGVAFIGDENAETQKTIVEIGKVASLGRLPTLSEVTPNALRHAFRENFDVGAFRRAC